MLSFNPVELKLEVEHEIRRIMSVHLKMLVTGDRMIFFTIYRKKI